MSGVRAPHRPLNVSLSRSRVSDTCQRLAVRHFPRAQNGTYRFGVRSSGDTHVPRLVQAVPKYRKHRASGQAIVTISGRDHYLGPFNSKASKVENATRSHHRRARRRLPAVRQRLLRRHTTRHLYDDEDRGAARAGSLWSHAGNRVQRLAVQGSAALALSATSAAATSTS
jgi:hypothetical protein